MCCRLARAIEELDHKGDAESKHRLEAATWIATKDSIQDNEIMDGMLMGAAQVALKRTACAQSGKAFEARFIY